MSTAVAVFAPYDEAEKHAEDSTLGWHKSAERVAVARDRDAALAASISVDINTGKYTLIFQICFGCVWVNDPAFRGDTHVRRAAPAVRHLRRSRRS
jgi:hypothetical protein